MTELRPSTCLKFDNCFNGVQSPGHHLDRIEWNDGRKFKERQSRSKSQKGKEGGTVWEESVRAQQDEGERCGMEVECDGSLPSLMCRGRTTLRSLYCDAFSSGDSEYMEKGTKRTLVERDLEIE